jgi:hypothetical protein
VAAEGVLGRPSVVLPDDRVAPIADCVAAEQAFNPPGGGAATDEAGVVGGAELVLAATDQLDQAVADSVIGLGRRGLPSHGDLQEEREVGRKDR